jgi:KipI family sensor histidine kinase inhibitor
MGGRPSISAFGDAAILVELDSQATGAPLVADGSSTAGAVDMVGSSLLASTAAAQALASRIRSATVSLPDFGASVPAASSVLVHLSSASAGVEDAIEVVRQIVEGFDAASSAWPSDAPTIDVPVRYGGADGPDLDAVANRLGLTHSAVVELHASTVYHVLFLGFAPGFGYLGPLPAGLIVPRRASPRVKVPAGSVAIAGQHAAIYSVESPGGWQILGRTTTRMWDPDRWPPALLEPGMLVRFVPEPSR